MKTNLADQFILRVRLQRVWVEPEEAGVVVVGEHAKLWVKNFLYNQSEELFLQTSDIYALLSRKLNTQFLFQFKLLSIGNLTCLELETLSP